MKEKLKPYMLLLPTLTLILAILIPGITNALFESFGYSKAYGMKGITLTYYKEVLFHSDFMGSLRFSLITSLTSSLIALFLGTTLAFCVYMSSSRKALEKFIFKLPIIVPHIIAASAAFSILAQSGILARLLFKLRFINSMEHMPLFIFDRQGIGIMLTYLWKEIPFTAMVVYTVLKDINHKLYFAARNLGANKRQVFFHIMLPLCLPSMLSAFIIIFAFSFGAFEVPYLLGPTFPRALAVKAYMEYTGADLFSRPYAMVINIILTCISIILIYLYDKILKISNHSQRGGEN
ncbi:ABC transporter permease [Clostridium sp. UBA4548]|uniref:ABC transporter permease n=1 Tax=Clostridium sp. UBA4548 TaxID=1946361 RepID=UPI0025BC9C40|nr:ABC transporter permease subunit [Clostridium sp. UBA4548]